MTDDEKRAFALQVLEQAKRDAEEQRQRNFADEAEALAPRPSKRAVMERIVRTMPQSQGFVPPANKTHKRATLYMIGASYGQIALLERVTKPTVHALISKYIARHPEILSVYKARAATLCRMPEEKLEYASNLYDQHSAMLQASDPVRAANTLSKLLESYAE